MPKQTKYTIERGGVARPVYGVRRRVEREQHDVMIAATDGVSDIIDHELRHWAYDLRKGRRRVCGGLFRFLDLMHWRGFAKETALEIHAGIGDYIDALWSSDPAEHVVEDRAA
jgi:hypothetical protein